MNHGNGRMDKRTATPLSGRATPQGVDGSDETDKKVRPGKGVPEADGTGQAVQEVRGCDYPSCLLLSNSHLFPTPEKTVETDRSELMTALKNTYFMEKNGCWLADVNPEKADSVHGMLAMHTFMRDAYLKVYPESKRNGRHRKKYGHLYGFWISIGKRVTCGNSATWLCILCRPHGMWHSGTGLRMIMTGLTDCTVPTGTGI